MKAAAAAKGLFWKGELVAGLFGCLVLKVMLGLEKLKRLLIEKGRLDEGFS